MSKQYKEQIAGVVKRVTQSSRGHDILLYLLFVCVAFVLWVFLSLDADIQRDFDVPVQLDNVPDSVVIINDLPSAINVVAQGKGSQFVRYQWGKMPSLKINFNDIYVKGGGSVGIPKAKLESMLRDYFGQGVKITSLRPDSIGITYTSNPGQLTLLHVNADVKANLQSIISGPIRANYDSVMVYFTSNGQQRITQVETETLVKTDLSDTTVYQVHVKQISGARIVPEVVTVTIPVEPLISKKRTITIEKLNLPNGMDMTTFPSAIEVSYLVPMSRYNTDYPMRAFVDYNDISTHTDKVRVLLSGVPDAYHNVIFKPDSVEFYIESQLSSH